MLDLRQLYKKVQEKEITYKELCNLIENYSEDYFQKTGERLSASFLDRCGNLLIYAIEKEDQEREKERLKKKTRDEWVIIEKEIIPNPNQYKKILDKIDRYFNLGMIDSKERDILKKRFRKCKNFKCENAVFIEGKNKYCSDRCRIDEYHSKRRARETKTKLIMSDFIPKLSFSKERDYRSYEKLILDEVKINYRKYP